MVIRGYTPDVKVVESRGKSEGLSNKLNCISLRGTVQYGHHHDVNVVRCATKNRMSECHLTS